jgi:hypothetical protein
MNELKPFDKCLVRNSFYELWIPALFGREKDGRYLTSAGWQMFCIPYEGNEDILGTTNAVIYGRADSIDYSDDDWLDRD